MSSTFNEIEKEARSLSADERARLAEVLLESLSDTPVQEVMISWDQEIERRVAAFERGEVKAHLAEDVLAEARRLLK